MRTVIIASILLAVIITIGSVYGWPHVLNHVDSGHAALILALITMCGILWRVHKCSFSYGFLSGVIIGLIQNIAIILMWNEFVFRHPNHANFEALFDKQNPIPFLTYKMAIAIGTPILAVCYGLILGSCAWLRGVLIRKHGKEN